VLGDIMDAHDRGPLQRRGDIGDQRADDAVLRLSPRHLAYKAFSRRPDHDGKSARGELRRPGDDLEVLLRRLAEPDPGVEGNAVFQNAGAPGDGEGALEECQAGLDQVARQRLCRAEQAGIVHGDHAGAMARGDLRQVRVSLQAADVVDDMRAGGNRCLGDGGLHRVDRNQCACRDQAFDDRDDTLLLFLRRHGGRIATGGFAADVEDGGALPGKQTAVRHRGPHIGKQAAVGEGIRRDVDDPHDDGRTRPPALAPAAEQIRKAAAAIAFGSGGAVRNVRRHGGVLEQGRMQDNLGCGPLGCARQA
jgi:hypothetical protein